MSNTVSELKQVADQLFAFNCPELDVDDQMGPTGYIDFIKPNDFYGSCRKGIDCANRKFITFRAEIEYSNGQKLQTFTTLFERRNIPDAYMIQSANKYTLFYTDGGATVEQLKLVLKLLNDKVIGLSEEMAKDCKIRYPGALIEDNYSYKPVKISLINDSEIV